MLVKDTGTCTFMESHAYFKSLITICKQLGTVAIKLIKGTSAKSFGSESTCLKILFIHLSQSRNVMLNL